MTLRADGSPIASNDPPPSARATLILASSSPRRLDLLAQVGIRPDRVVVPEIDESVAGQELPRIYALRMALAKARAVENRLAGERAWIIAADTVVACGRRILPKVATEGEAVRCLELLSGRRHRVHGGICVIAPDGRTKCREVLTMVRMKRIAVVERTAYLASGEWSGKAGGYAIQGLAAALIPAINGSYSNVVGLPLVETLGLLECLGWRRP